MGSLAADLLESAGHSRPTPPRVCAGSSAVTVDHLVEWGLKAVMGLIAIMVTLLGRDLKRSEALVHERAESLMKETLLQFELRDQRLAVLEQRVDRASSKSSEEASRVMVKMADLSERLVRLEARS